MPRWRSCTCACVQASVAARSKAVASRCLSTRSSTRLAGCATIVQKAMRTVAPGAIAHPAAQREDRIEHGADGVGQAAGRRSPRSARGCCGRGRGSGPGRSRSPASPTAFAFDHGEMRRPDLRLSRRCAAAASPGGRLTSARYSVCTNSLEKAGCATSAACGASTSSA